jgi:hypothetical protein
MIDFSLLQLNNALLLFRDLLFEFADLIDNLVEFLLGL